MGLFDSKQKKYWKKNPDELKEIEQKNAKVLVEYNSYANGSPYVYDFMEQKRMAVKGAEILDWYEELEKRECPCRLSTSAAQLKLRFLAQINSQIVEANKFSSEDCARAIESLDNRASNYNACIDALKSQESQGWYFGSYSRYALAFKHFYDTNEDVSDCYAAAGLPQKEKRPESLRDKLPSDLIAGNKDSQDGDDVTTYFLALGDRYAYRHFPLNPIDASMYNLSLNNGEVLYARFNNVILHEEKIVNGQYVYSGMRWANGVLRGGTLNVTSPEIYRFKAMDIGRLFITNKRIIFVGAQNRITKASPYTSVITYDLYGDGVLIRLANSRGGLLYKFQKEERHEGMLILEDWLNTFTAILTRIFEHTENDKQ